MKQEIKKRCVDCKTEIKYNMTIFDNSKLNLYCLKCMPCECGKETYAWGYCKECFRELMNSSILPKDTFKHYQKMKLKGLYEIS